jgi:hypothetical protein
MKCQKECIMQTAFCIIKQYEKYYEKCPCKECILKVNCSQRCEARNAVWKYLHRKELVR